MKLLLSLLITLFVLSEAQAQKIDSDFDSLTSYYRSRLFRNKDSINIPLMYKDKDFNIVLADTSLGIQTESVVFESPYLKDSFPLSYSVIYDKHIISLFEPGYFACYRLSDFSRNKDFEDQLNKQKFKSHWLIGNILHAITYNEDWYAYVDSNWEKIDKIALPVNNKSNLYDDEDYLIYSDCYGEWGGTIYFYNRKTKNIHFTKATCAYTVLKDKTGYKVLSSLSHADLILIPDPTKLPKTSEVMTGTSGIQSDAQEIFSLYWLEIFSMFNINEKVYYIVYWKETTFLAEINGKNIIIVDPLFNNHLFTHRPITKKYESGEILINLDFWGLGREREVSMLLLKDNKLTKIDWNSDQKQTHNFMRKK
ncbi:hypothetical protein [Chondrinema litorale]|uniref:hypothetical protein n=1 Tax=Chondrinema litorale TaxID=2994555 RepID=UPI00254296E8|nr:hypothetical protein [Chondrinema litorale]UZR96093.1 hypothetical protein OQ292_09770 [Chondrinema litorale]